MAAKPSFELRLRVLNAVFDAPGDTMRDRIRHIAAQPFTDVLAGHTYRFTWRTISTWLYRHKKNGMTTLQNKIRSDKDAYRKVQVNQLAEAIHETLPTLARNKTGVLPKSVLYRVLLQRGFFARSQLSPTTFYRMLRDHQLLDDNAVQKHRLSFAMPFANELWQAESRKIARSVKPMSFQSTRNVTNVPLICARKPFRCVTTACAGIASLSISMTIAWARLRCWIWSPMPECACLKYVRQARRVIMIKATFGLTKEPFYRSDLTLLPQQREVIDMIRIHAQHGGFSVITGNPGVGKSVIREHLEQLGKERDAVVVSFIQTMHTYLPILKQLAESLHLSVPLKDIESELIKAAYRHVQSQKNLYVIIDEAHLLDVSILRKLRLLFERFPKKHNLVLLGHPELMYRLSMMSNDDIKNRISYSKQVLPLNDDDLTHFILTELAAVGLGANTFDEAALQIILRAVQGNLRLTRNLCYASLIAACLDQQRICTVSHVNTALLQPHWRSHEALLKQQVKPNRVSS